ncbi:hypothetical protein BP5796_02317 [Coleophoma crateriformis]|uniref:DNA polymerase epsilon subunit B n=1 Tax=Coleophoma crateriformis TaxID=565419 RepID=A0A3D8SXU7_9HELO|nr:hypothetical protein BP5796_02317 [Coleophoma crateriformis]
MSKSNPTDKPRAAPMFKAPRTPAQTNPIPSSSPAFGTPAHPIRPFNAVPATAKQSVLPILLPPATLRPVAFRTFTKKHSLTLTSSALQVLATFIGRHCGTGWREEGLAERVLEEVAKSWKNYSKGVIVEGDSSELKDILKNLEGSMIGGRIVASRELSRQNSLNLGPSQYGDDSTTRLGLRPGSLGREDSQSSLGMSMLEMDEHDEDALKDPRKWLKVIDAFEQPRLVYNVAKKHFDRDSSKPSLLPQASHKTQVFRNRYNLIHQRILRNESFQTSAVEASKTPSLKRTSSALATAQQSYKLTPIANLLGRNGSNHMILGLLTISPTGTLAINDLTGSIALDLSHAKPVPEDGAWFAPGMIVLVDGVYEEDDNHGGTLGGSGGVGGTIGGKFIGFFIGGPPCERRSVTLGLTGTNGEGDTTAGGGFGWVDFLGVGSERAVGSKMRKLEQRLLGKRLEEGDGVGRGRMILVGEINLDQPRTLQALKKLLGIYAAEPEEDTPMTFVLMGNFVQHAVMARGGSGGSIEYKEYFDALASTLSEYPTLLQAATFIFVPGDNDGWASSFSAGAATRLPRKGIPEMFTSRIKRAFATANAEAEKEGGKRADGEAIWTSNPSRLTVFGPMHEILILRDNMSGRLRRTAVQFTSAKPSDGDGDVEMATTPALPPSATEIDEDVRDAESHEPEAISEEDKLTHDTHIARKLVKTVLDQGYLSPFGLAIRPVLWDYASALQVYPLPTAMILADTEAPAFCVTYEGCHVMNPGGIVAPGRRGVARWVEYDLLSKAGKVREALF